jgi:hypothetical protein
VEGILVWYLYPGCLCVPKLPGLSPWWVLSSAGGDVAYFYWMVVLLSMVSVVCSLLFTLIALNVHCGFHYVCCGGVCHCGVLRTVVYLLCIAVFPVVCTAVVR